MKKNHSHLTRLPLLALAGFTTLATMSCEARNVEWSADLAKSPSFTLGLEGSVAIVDHPTNRVLMLPVEGDLSLSPTAIPIGHGFATARGTKDGKRLFALSRGDVPRRKTTDQGPSLQVIDGSINPKALDKYELSDPLSGLELDPQSEYAVIFPSASDTQTFVQNPNELILVKLLEAPSASNPVPISLRSFGGRPQAFTFTPELEVPGGKRRLLVTSTDRDIALVDLSAPDKPEITVKLTGGADVLRPVGTAVSDGEPGVDTDARIAVRMANDNNVIIMDLLPVPAGSDSPHSFLPVPNINYVGGIPSDMAFVNTDGGLRLAALVPSKKTLTLVEPVTGTTTDVALGAPFDRMTIVTDIVGETTNGGDIALVWSTSSPNVAFVALGVTIGKPYKSVERVELSESVSAVLDVPAPNDHLKILALPSGKNFVVLDLLTRTASPILAGSGGAKATISRNGQRAWLVAQNTNSVGQLELATLHPKNVYLNYNVQNAFEIERRDGGRALVAIHGGGTMGATVFDAANPVLDNSTETLGLLLGEFQ
jgi:hypothetical protein